MIIGSERHEARRIDNQLRGRSGRQGDPGISSFYLSLEDDLMRRFGSERMDNMLGKLGLKKDEAIIHPWINKAIETAQKKVESMHYEVRKNLLKFDDVMNDQRKVVYEQRKDLMRSEDVANTVKEMRHDVIQDIVEDHIPEKSYQDQWDMDGMKESTSEFLNLDLELDTWIKEDGIDEEKIIERISDSSDRMFAGKATKYGIDLWRMAEKSILLQVLDQSWKEHLLALDHLRQGIGLRAYGQRDPLNEYRAEAFDMFEGVLDKLREEVTKVLSHIELRLNDEEDTSIVERKTQETHEGREDPGLPSPIEDTKNQANDEVSGISKSITSSPNINPETEQIAKPFTTRARKTDFDQNDPSTWGRIGRNEKCPCGSNKKYKHCCGKFK